MISTFDLTLSNPVVAPKHWGGCASWYRMATEPPCMPALTRWTTRQDVVVISLQEALKGKQEKRKRSNVCIFMTTLSKTQNERDFSLLICFNKCCYFGDF